MFGKIDHIATVSHNFSDVFLDRINNSLPQKVLYLSLEVYRELDYYLLTRQIDDFCNRMIYISDQISSKMIELTHSSSDINFLLERALSEGVINNHEELKTQIITMLRNKNVSESVLGALYDLILEHQMQLPNF